MLKTKVVVIGQGYVGLPVAMRACEADFDVVGLDNDLNRIQALKNGRSFVEDISDLQVAEALSSGRYLPTTNYSDSADFDVAVISVPTPLKEGVPDLTFIESSSVSLAPHLRKGATVVLESTTYPGTTEELLVPLLERGSGLRAGTDFYVGYSPERIDPGNSKWNFVNTPKVVSGIDELSLQKVDDFYSRLVETTVRVSGTAEAELTKLLENTFRHVNIALVNELALFANQLGVNVWESIDAASTKPFGYMRFTPGPGVGGHCLPVDPSYLSWQVKRKLGRNFRFVELANDVNDHMPDYVVQRVTSLLNKKEIAVSSAKVLLLGLSYKKNSGDIREAPSTRIIELLEELGADISAIDTHVSQAFWPENVTKVDIVSPNYRSYDVAIMITDHDDLQLSELLESDVPVFDTRNQLSGTNVEVL